jgi:enolase-phosphatase E1
VPPEKAIAGIVLDVEGTTTPVSFVHDVLFPFAAARLEAACARAALDPEVAGAIAQLRREHAAEAAGADVPAFDGGSAYARYLMRQDRKSTGLKALQGLIWEAGYREGQLRAPVYDDVPRALEAWRDAGIRLRVYSSGSVLAQRLLFAHTDHGDLTGYFEGYHDTTTGPKKEAASYRSIAEAYGLAPARLLFLSDLRAELDAAREAGLSTGMLARPGNPPADAGPHPVFADFTALI